MSHTTRTTPVVWTCGVCFAEVWREDRDEAAWWSAVLDHFATHPDAVAAASEPGRSTR